MGIIRIHTGFGVLRPEAFVTITPAQLVLTNPSGLSWRVPNFNIRNRI